LLRHPVVPQHGIHQEDPELHEPQDDYSRDGTLLDLYAGTGTIGILLAKYFQKVYSVELVESASRDGEANALRNSIPNVEFVNAKVEDFAAEFAKNSGKADTIVLDPPRDGLHPSAIPHILSFGASEIIYVSCNPSTLVRDLQLMIGDGFPSENTESLEIPKNEIPKTKYCITDITPMDMFPHTHHIETVVRLERI
jgi:23S rRNA (uracil1939-C5)-methyltransferase